LENTVAGYNFLFPAAAVVLASVGIASAETLVWGQAELKAGTVRIGNRSGEALQIDDTSPESYDFAGRIGADLGAFGAELMLQYGAYDNASGADFGHDWGRQAAVRVTYDVSPAVALGAVYGAGSAQPLADPRAQHDFYAIEGAYATGDLVLGLQFGRFDAQDGEATNAFHDGRFTRIGAIYTLGNNGVIAADVGLFDGRQDTGSPYAMDGSTWSVEYSRQINEKPLAWSVGLDGGSFQNYDAPGVDNGAFDVTRATVGLTAWFGDGDLASAKRRGIFGQPDFGRILDTGNEVD
jgi:hypothetical protein